MITTTANGQRGAEPSQAADQATAATIQPNSITAAATVSRK
ncbi:MAG: hypothetical protein AAF805_02090 [Planctomycetota bacterium]